MFEFFKDFKERRLIKKLINSPFLATSFFMLKENLWGDRAYKYPIIHQMDEENKKLIFSRIFEILNEIFKAEDPFIRKREIIAGLVIKATSLEVIQKIEIESLKEHRLHPAITYELYNYLDKIAHTDEDIKELSITANNDIEILKNLIQLEYEINICLLGPVLLFQDSENMDWWEDYYQKMLISSENDYRNLLGLESFADKYYGYIGGLKCAIYTKFVVEGYDNPKYEWDEFCKSFNEYAG